MRSRVQSSVLVVFIGLVPAIAGGPVFTALMIVLGILGFRELVALAAHAGVPMGAPATAIGSIVVAALGVLALVSSTLEVIVATMLFAAIAPLMAQLPQTDESGAIFAWSMTTAGALYVGLPMFTAVSLRSMPGQAEASWLQGLAAVSGPLWPPASMGLAWTLLVIVATWIGDSAAYLVGRKFGRRKLAPLISPGKTIEGSIGGLVGAAATGAIAFATMGLGSWVLGLAAGSLIGVAGQLGDLCESFLKRQVGVKDSGSLIPGHGGILDRIDALLFAFPVALLLALTLERWRIL